MGYRNSVLDKTVTRLIDFHARRITNAADAIDDQDYVTLSQLNKGLDNIKPGADGNIIQNITNNTVTGGAAVIKFFTLTANLTLNTISGATPPLANTLLLVILKQDGTGGWTTTWGTDFQTFPGDLQVLPNTTSSILFGAYSGKWYYASIAVTGK